MMVALYDVTMTFHKTFLSIMRCQMTRSERRSSEVITTAVKEHLRSMSLSVFWFSSGEDHSQLHHLEPKTSFKSLPQTPQTDIT